MLQKNINRLETDFNKRLKELKFKVQNCELTPEKKAERRKLADVDDLAFAKIYYPQIFDEPFNGIHEYIAKLVPGMWPISGSRKFGKSTFGYISQFVKPIALDEGGICVLCLRTLEQTKERTSMIRRIIMKNKLLLYDYDIELVQDKKGFYIFGKTHFIAGSFETGLRSIIDDDFKRIRRIICDDMYNATTVKSQVDNDKIVKFWESEVSGALERGATAIFFGNTISEICPMAIIAEKYPKTYFSMPACDTEGHTNWKGHSLFTDEYWETFQHTIDYVVWQGEYMCTPCVVGEMFQLEWLRSINLNMIQITHSLSALDPSFGKTPEACYKGLVTLGLTSKNEPVVLDIYLRQEDYFRVFDYVAAIRASTPFWKILLFENDFNQFYIARPYYEQWQEARNDILPIMKFTSKSLKTDQYGSDKISRIMNLIHPHQSGIIKYNSAIIKNADYNRFVNQYIAFGGNTTEKLDGLDALATAFIMLKRFADRGNFQALGERKMKKESMFNDY